MARVEYPCYEYFVEFKGDKSFEDYVKYPGDCNMSWSSSEILMVNSKWVIQKRRRSKLRSTGSVICDDDIKE